HVTGVQTCALPIYGLATWRKISLHRYRTARTSIDNPLPAEELESLLKSYEVVGLVSNLLVGTLFFGVFLSLVFFTEIILEQYLLIWTLSMVLVLVLTLFVLSAKGVMYGLEPMNTEEQLKEVRDLMQDDVVKPYGMQISGET